MEKLDIELIMKDIRKEIEEKGLKEDLLDFNEITQNFDNCLDEISIQLKYLNQNYSYNPYGEIKSRKGIMGTIIIFIKKIIRKCINFHVAPIAIAQGEFNENLVVLLNELEDYIKDKDRKISQLEKEISEIKNGK